MIPILVGGFPFETYTKWDASDPGWLMVYLPSEEYESQLG